MSDYPESWYPLCLSADVKNGKSKPVRLFETDWLLFRTHDGELGVVDRFCPHMGTDLLNGRVVGKCIECPLHRWKFGAKGKCTDTGQSRVHPHQAQTNHLFTEERYGIIFVFWGDKPSFELPLFTNLPEPIFSQPGILALKNNYLAVAVNGFDMQHLSGVHNRVVEGSIVYASRNVFHLGMKFTLRVRAKRWQDRLIQRLGMGTSDIQYDYWGGNHILVRSFPAKFSALFTLLPGETYDECKAFLVVVSERNGRNPFTRLLGKWKLCVMRYFAMSFLRQDVAVIKNMRPGRGVLSLEADQAVIRFWEYMEELPRYSIHKQTPC